MKPLTEQYTTQEQISNSLKRDSPPVEIICYECKQPGHYKSQCPKRKRRSQVFSISSPDSLSDNDIVVPIQVNHQNVLALDTMAEISCISRNLAESLNIVPDGSFQILVANSDVYQDVPTATLELSCARKSIVTRVAIILSTRPFLLGKDVMYLFGIKVDGIPAEFTNVKLPPSGEESDHIRSSAPEVKKPSEAEQQVLAGVEDVLRINQRLERSHMCTLEYAEVSQDTGNSVPINRLA